MKEKEVRLTVEEIDYLLKGSIHWDDIESRVGAPLRKPLEPKYEKRPLEKAIASEPLLEGNTVYWVLSGVVFITLGTWAYFVFAG